MKTMLRRTTATALLLAAPLALTACGGEDKPSKTDVTAGMTKMLSKENAGNASSADKVNKMSKCLVDETYSKLSTKALSAIAKADETSKSLTSEDDKALSSATTTCQKNLGA